ncbi:DUF6445 family protein [Alteromonas sp. a30]|uniref:DUF6445 family protein n=1 Tax=Alteromonas sp. a30 TaxID=2730917 RepID=UPI002280BBD4|nr:DUF6445 family protein [Alteromonas sp. a30]MCY7297329.1 hypothetical protein [Alteromonas sp. a30]
MIPTRINPQCQVALKRIGQEQQPLIVIRDCWAEPEALIALAQSEDDDKSQHVGFKDDPNDFYPGLRKPLSTDFQQALSQALSTLLQAHLSEHFSTLDIPVSKSVSIPFCAFSLTNTAPAQLLPIQRIPHFDSTSSRQFALVSYLFKQDKGGTAFYRHKKTGFEYITDSRAKMYMKSLQTQASTEGFPEAAYINASTPLFEQIHCESAQFNTCILYPANVLHSGCIYAEKSLSSCPENGRLTLNACLDFE